MLYVGHSSVYYRGSNGYSLLKDEKDPSFYSVYFDNNALPTIRIMSGCRNVINLTAFERLCRRNGIDSAFRPDQFVKWLIDDLDQTFDITVEVIV